MDKAILVTNKYNIVDRLQNNILKSEYIQKIIKMDSAEGGEIPNVNGVDGYKLFVTHHQNQLESSGVPQHFWKTVYKKLSNMVS